MFDPTKPVQTRDGRPARILCTDRKTPTTLTIIALVTEGNEERQWSFHPDGSFVIGKTSHSDLVNIPTKRSRWINIYKSVEWVQTFAKKEDAIATGMRSKSYVTTIQIEWEE